ncbi:MAG: DUF367 family protein [Candidatus Hydrothermarchaeaceae archaeon]
MVPVKLLIYHSKECNPKACTAMKLKKFDIAKVFYTPRRIPKNSIVLSPFSNKVLSASDVRYLKNGLVALDCSWKRITETRIKKPVHARVLPPLVASNPINYGKVGKLSTAEALSSALYILGEKERAKEVLSKFKWGTTFFELNKELLEAYNGKIS